MATPLNKVADSTAIFNKIITFAGKIDLREMLADMKTAKDNFLNGSLKNSRKRSARNPY